MPRCRRAAESATFRRTSNVVGAVAEDRQPAVVAGSPGRTRRRAARGSVVRRRRCARTRASPRCRRSDCRRARAAPRRGCRAQDHAPVLARPLEDLLHDGVLRAPTSRCRALHGPEVDDVADQHRLSRVVVAQEVEQALGLAGAGARGGCRRGRSCGPARVIGGLRADEDVVRAPASRAGRARGAACAPATPVRQRVAQGAAGARRRGARRRGRTSAARTSAGQRRPDGTARDVEVDHPERPAGPQHRASALPGRRASPGSWSASRRSRRSPTIARAGQRVGVVDHAVDVRVAAVAGPARRRAGPGTGRPGRRTRTRRAACRRTPGCVRCRRPVRPRAPSVSAGSRSRSARGGRAAGARGRRRSAPPGAR